jgi:seryl-tRNA synthetase
MDPFFIEDFAQQTAFQLAFDLKFEIRANLPYSQGSIAAGSFNYHQDFFGKSFDIRDASGAPVHTGCVGYGLERLVLSFVAHHGLSPDGWPQAVRKLV